MSAINACTYRAFNDRESDGNGLVYRYGGLGQTCSCDVCGGGGGHQRTLCIVLYYLL